MQTDMPTGSASAPHSSSYDKNVPLIQETSFSSLVPSEHSERPIPTDKVEVNKGVLKLDAVVIGASWAGIWALYRLQSLGLNVKLLDACANVGGVWWYTRYPGCRVDTEIPFYEFSKKELWQKWNWTERFPSREEIHRYLSWVCDELDLRKNIILRTRVNSALWDDRSTRWTVSTDDGLVATAQFILPCAGYSTIRYIPDIPGLERFPAKFHTSAWPEYLDCSDKNIAVIGTAASGIQVIEAVGKTAKTLVVFQRTPNLATPMRNQAYTDEEMAGIKKNYPRWFAERNSRNGFEVNETHLSFQDGPQSRNAFFENLWQRGGLAFWFANYRDMLEDPVANVRAYNFWRKKVRQRINDRDKAEILAPIRPPHAFGTKRPSLEMSYFEVFNQSNVDIVDVNSNPVVEVTPDGLLTASGDFYAVDIIALATGFDFLTGSMLAMGIEGRDGRQLSDRWNIEADGDGVFTHLGLMTAEFPNMFFPMGPQAPSALGLTPQMAEIQGDWIADLLVWMREQGKSVVEPTFEAELAWKEEVNRAADDSLFGQTDSWYMGLVKPGISPLRYFADVCSVNIPGRKKQPLCYFGGVDTYTAKLEESARTGYAGFVFRRGHDAGPTHTDEERGVILQPDARSS